jgi:hypothetical protein
MDNKMLHNELNELFDREIKRLGIQYSVSLNAPQSFHELIRHCTLKSLVIWPGGSDNTIYGDPRINWKFRAWHDALHLITNAPFTVQGETFMGKLQASKLGTLGSEIVIAEVIGQAEEFNKTGQFINNQVAFINNALKVKGLIK